MKLLAIDTATEACSAALYIDGEITECYQVAPRQHADIILPMCNQLLEQADVKLNDIDCLAFGRGPGAFTGVRIAAGVIQGLAFATDLPVVPVSTLAAMAQGQWHMHGHHKILTAIDARINEVYWSAFECNDEAVTPVIDEQVCAANDVNLPTGSDWIAVGSGWETYANDLQARTAAILKEPLKNMQTSSFPRAQDIITLAVRAFKNNEAVPAEQALPVYLRDNVAHKKKT